MRIGELINRNNVAYVLGSLLHHKNIFIHNEMKHIERNQIHFFRNIIYKWKMYKYTMQYCTLLNTLWG